MKATLPANVKANNYENSLQFFYIFCSICTRNDSCIESRSLCTSEHSGSTACTKATKCHTKSHLGLQTFVEKLIVKLPRLNSFTNKVTTRIVPLTLINVTRCMSVYYSVESNRFVDGMWVCNVTAPKEQSNDDLWNENLFVPELWLCSCHF